MKVCVCGEHGREVRVIFFLNIKCIFTDMDIEGDDSTHRESRVKPEDHVITSGAGARSPSTG